MQNVQALADSLPDAAKDLRLNLPSVLGSELLSRDQIWGTALASAYFLRQAKLRDAILADAKTLVSDAVIEDAKASASLMGMNTIYYRFRHLIGNEGYSRLPARLRMQRMVNPATTRADFEMFSLACAALAGCEACLKAHEASLRKEGLTEGHVHDAIRIAAALSGVAVALEI